MSAFYQKSALLIGIIGLFLSNYLNEQDALFTIFGFDLSLTKDGDLILIVKWVAGCDSFVCFWREGLVIIPVAICLYHLTIKFIVAVLILQDNCRIDLVVKLVCKVSGLFGCRELVGNAIQQIDSSSQVLSSKANLCVYFSINEDLYRTFCIILANLLNLCLFEDMNCPHQFDLLLFINLHKYLDFIVLITDYIHHYFKVFFLVQEISVAVLCVLLEIVFGDLTKHSNPTLRVNFGRVVCSWFSLVGIREADVKFNIFFVVIFDADIDDLSSFKLYSIIIFLFEKLRDLLAIRRERSLF